MAKIYETKDDLKHDILKDQAKDLKLQSAHQNQHALSFIGLSFFTDWFKDRKPQTRGWLGYVSAVLAIAGIVDWVRSMITYNKAHNVELEEQRMGPQRVVLPPDQPSHEAVLQAQETLRRHGIEPRSHEQYAERVSVLPIVK